MYFQLHSLSHWLECLLFPFLLFCYWPLICPNLNPEAWLEVAGLMAILYIHCKKDSPATHPSLLLSHLVFLSLIHPIALLMVSIVSLSTLCENGTREECTLRKTPERS